MEGISGYPLLTSAQFKVHISKAKEASNMATPKVPILFEPFSLLKTAR